MPRLPHPPHRKDRCGTLAFRAGAAFVALLAFVFVARSADAQPLAPPSYELAHLHGQWERYRETGQAAMKQEDFDALIQRRDELGIHEMPTHAMALVAEARAALEEGSPGQAARLRARAERLAPSTVAPEFLRADELLASSRWNAVGALIGVHRAWNALLDTPTAADAAHAWLWRLVWHATLFGTLAGALALWWRHRRRLAADLRALTRFGLTATGSAVVVLALTAALPLWYWSPAALILAALGLTTLSLGLRARIAALALVGSLWLLPTVAQMEAESLYRASTPLTPIAMATVAPCDASCIAHLENAMGGPHADQAALSLAWVQWRRGTQSSREQAHAALAARSETAPGISSAALLAGNLAFVSGDYDTAETQWATAAETAPDPRALAAALVNLRLALERQGRTAEANDVATRAVSADRTLANRHLGVTSSSQNRVLASMPSVDPSLLHVSADDTWRDELIAERMSPALGHLTPNAFEKGAWLVALLLLLGALLSPLRITATSCRRCGTPTGRFLHGEAFSAHLCVGCYQLDRFAGQLSKFQLDARERPLRWAKHVRPRLEAVMAVFLPGPALMAAGRPIIGFLVLVPTAIGVALLSVERTLLQVPFVTEVRPYTDGAELAGAMLLLLSAFISVTAMVLTEWWSD